MRSSTKINAAAMDTVSACGDVNRNVLGASNPLQSALHAQVHDWAQRLSLHFKPATRAYYELLGYPNDYLTTYPEKVRAVTPADVQTAATKYLHPDKMVVLIVGKTTGLNPAVTTLGQVSPVQLDPVSDAPGDVSATPKVP